MHTHTHVYYSTCTHTHNIGTCTHTHTYSYAITHARTHTRMTHAHTHRLVRQGGPVCGPRLGHAARVSLPPPLSHPSPPQQVLFFHQGPQRSRRLSLYEGSPRALFSMTHPSPGQSPLSMRDSPYGQNCGFSVDNCKIPYSVLSNVSTLTPIWWVSLYTFRRLLVLTSDFWPVNAKCPWVLTWNSTVSCFDPSIVNSFSFLYSYPLVPLCFLRVQRACPCPWLHPLVLPLFPPHTGEGSTPLSQGHHHFLR